MTQLLLPSLIALREHLHLRLRPAVRPDADALIDDGILLCEAAIAAALGSEPPLEELRQRGLLSTDDSQLPAQFYHGTRADLKPGDLLEPGRPSNFGERNAASFVYLTGSLDAAAWGAELALGEGPGRIYVVEPTGPIMPDPDLTKGGGNPTRSYRSEQPLRVVGEYTGAWGHAPISIKRMKDSIARLSRKPPPGD
jgi:hypothetical protein